MIGQTRLINEFKNKTLDTLNHSNLIIAPKGAGKHTFVTEVANMFNVEIIDITDNIDLDVIEQLRMSSTVKFCLINATKISIKEQNMILKLVEEPPTTVFIFILATSENIIIPTVYNRCIAYTLDRYSLDELKSFTDDSVLLSLFDTPGMLEKAKTQNMTELIKLVYNFIDNVKRANYSNLLTVANKMNFSNDNALFDLDIFIETLLNEIAVKIINNNAHDLIPLFNLVKRCKYELNMPNVNKKYIFEKFLLDAKES